MFRDWAAEVAYFPKEVIEHALAHKLKDEAEAAYQRGTLPTNDLIAHRAVRSRTAGAIKAQVQILSAE